jgi:hydrogenase expression/formation protein HypE
MSAPLAPGKVPWELIADLVSGALPPEVRLGPAQGEDAALVEIGGELWAVASDPVSFTARDAGRLAVIVNANDISVRGARPRFFLAVLLLAPAEACEERVRELLGQVRCECDRLGIALIGGHSEVAPGLGQSVVVGTMLGRVEGRALTTGGVRPGDRIGMTRWAGLEGTAILAAELGSRLEAVGEPALRRLEELAGPHPLSVVEAAAVAAAEPEVHALHDVTEGGVGEALHELAQASGLALEIDRVRVPVLADTVRLTGLLGLDPLGLIGSGSLLVACGEDGATRLEGELASAGLPFAWIGRADAPADHPGSGVPRFARDELLKVEALAGIRGVVFDMDGTLVESIYDWPAIRRHLQVTTPSILDELDGLAEPERSERWAALRDIELEATRTAGLKSGARDLLAMLAGRGIHTALVTNNSSANASELIDRFGLAFDVVLTRDSGLWKPSGAPVAEAVRRLGLDPAEVLAVGDSHFDLEAARAAGCGLAAIVFDGAERFRGAADLRWADLGTMRRGLEVVLGRET